MKSLLLVDAYKGTVMIIHYLEIVSLDVDAACNAHEIAHSVSFRLPDDLPGGAKTCVLSDDSIVGVRGQLRDTDEPVVRPY